MNKNINIGLLILRLTLGILMLFHGVSKLIYGLDGIEQLLISKGVPSFFAYGVYVGEILMPILIILGFWTRLAALAFALNMLVALLLVHAGDLFSLNQHGGWAVELIGLFFFGGLALFFTGGGDYSVQKDHKWS